MVNAATQVEGCYQLGKEDTIRLTTPAVNADSPSSNQVGRSTMCAFKIEGVGWVVKELSQR